MVIILPLDRIAELLGLYPAGGVCGVCVCGISSKEVRPHPKIVAEKPR